MSPEIKIRSGRHVITRVLGGSGIEKAIKLLSKEKQVFMVYDRNVEVHALKLSKAVKGQMALDTCEENKTLDTVAKICSWLLESGANRNALLLAVGGGITTDMAGMAASIYKRGIRFAFVPTTLLAQVDAAIGGKTGVNFLSYKNMLGTIRQPEFTFICPDTLTTLSRRDFYSGAAEMLKSFIIDNSDHDYPNAVRLLRAMRADGWSPRDYVNEIQYFVFKAAGIKAGIVGRDQFEKGERRLLNLGHTFAHAIEHRARHGGLDITHGEAVAIGIVLAAKVADRLSGNESNMYEKMLRDFTDCGFNVTCPFELEDLAEAMRKDKKAEGEKIHFVLPYAVGDVRIVDLSVDEILDIK